MQITMRKTVLATVMIAAVAVTGGCSDNGQTDPDVPPPMGNGVAFGATMEEYHAAFADVEPISLTYQFTAELGSDVNAPYEAHLAAVEEWSDGKVTFDRAYSGSLVPNVTEWGPALADGRIDIGYFLPYVTPGVFPKLTLLSNGTLLDGTAPTATLLSTATFSDAIYADPSLQEEAEAGGVHLLLRPPNFSLTGYFCPEEFTSAADFAGANVSVAGEGQLLQAQGIGAQPQSIAYTELYEALQRGVVDCLASSPTTVQTFGATDLVTHMTIDRETGLANFLGFYAVGKEAWDSLPLVAQQLLYDRLDMLIATLPRTDSVRNVQWLADAEALGGGIVEFEADAAAALSEANEALLARVAEGGIDVERLIATRDEWRAILTDELYPEVPTSIEEFLRTGGFSEDIDLTLFADALYERMLAQHRPR